MIIMDTAAAALLTIPRCPIVSFDAARESVVVVALAELKLMPPLVIWQRAGFRSFKSRNVITGRAETLSAFEDHTPVFNAVSEWAPTGPCR